VVCPSDAIPDPARAQLPAGEGARARRRGSSAGTWAR
jgi:hypothetical protein